MHLADNCQLICATLLTGVYDVNRNELLPNNDFTIVRKWYDSVVRLGLRGIIFHNSFSDKTVVAHENNHVSFVRVAYDGRLNANVFRYLVYQDFLARHADKIAGLFVTDIADVEVLHNPFAQPLFQENPTSLFCGDEAVVLDNEWMNAHSTHLRNVIPAFGEYEKNNAHQVLLNCGIIGGTAITMAELMTRLTTIHRAHTISNQTPYTLDMGAFNFVARTAFAARLIYGAPVNTRFKGYEESRMDCWFRHK